ncbi:MAG: hypothetical protein J5993_04330 [Clostridia bacterium]|nr:hypothetical protein [Clostridia bacterium]
MFLSRNVKNTLFGICLTGVLLFTGTPVSARADSFSPTVISSAKDLVAFSDAVNRGKTYENETVILANDVDVSGIDFTPIGEFTSPFSFMGVFEGNGHTIEGLTILDKTHTENNGLFGKLGGTVQNLTVKGYVQGNCCGGITSHVVGHAQIMNCAAFVTLEANRGGGIGDNLSTADVISCYSDSTNLGAPALLVSYQAHLVYRCASTSYLTDVAQTTLTEGCIELADGNVDAFFAEVQELLWKDGYGPFRTWKDNAPCGELYENDHTFRGKGTRSSPYLISSVEDFASLRNRVNGGETFRGKHFLQTEDLDFSGIRNIPVALYDTENTFDGTYDGGGHVMKNFKMDSLYHGGRNALFGNLSGIVKNLGMESGSIYGAFASSFAHRAKARKATIVNCYSRLDLQGEVRAAAITDNFTGLVVGCLYLHDTVDFPFTAYNVTTLAFSYHAGEQIILEGTSEFEPIDCYLLSALGEGELNEKLYRNLPAVAETSGVKLSSLYHMTENGFGEKVRLSDYSAAHYLSVYKYELIGVVALVGAAIILALCKDRRKP